MDSEAKNLLVGDGLALGVVGAQPLKWRKMVDLPETVAFRVALRRSSKAPIQSVSKEQRVWKLTSKPQLKETLFECGSCPELNQHGQARDEKLFRGWGQILNPYKCHFFSLIFSHPPNLLWLNMLGE